jgi:hypothetical protein
VNALAFVVGLAIVALTVVSVLFILVLPRQPSGLERISLVVNRTVRLVFVGLSRLAKTYEGKDAILAPTAPVALVAQLLFWATSLIVGFALMLVPTTHSFWQGLTQALTALFTVGAIHKGGAANLGIDIAAGATWVVIVALQIAYLPSLYNSFSRREGLVAMLESRAGSPAWGPEVTESHTTYPVLMLFRSPEAWLSWMIGLLAVLDAGAMQLALSPSSAPSQARLCLRMGFTLFNRVAVSMGWEVDPDPDPEGPIELDYEEFARAVERLAGYGFAMERTAQEAWADFRGWRVNYENSAYRLANHFTAPPAPWSGIRRHLRAGVVAPVRPPHRSPGGGIEDPSKRPSVMIPPRSRRARRSRRLRRSEDI